MKIHPITIVALLAVGIAAPGHPAAQNSPGSGDKMTQTENAVPGLHDFDFLVGRWQVHHRRLKERLANSQE